LKTRLCVVVFFGFFLQALHADKPGKAAIASAHYLATEAGHEILAKGGNAFDAAVAVSAVLAVVEQSSSGIGGGGFWLLHRASDGFEVMIDGREMAPAAADKDMYLDDGKVNRDLALHGPLAAAIPGEIAGFEHLAVNYGKLSLAESLQPAIRIAREGFPVYTSALLVKAFQSIPSCACCWATRKKPCCVGRRQAAYTCRMASCRK